jgi:hypothetical protein
MKIYERERMEKVYAVFLYQLCYGGKNWGNRKESENFNLRA